MITGLHSKKFECYPSSEALAVMWDADVTRSGRRLVTTWQVLYVIADADPFPFWEQLGVVLLLTRCFAGGPLRRISQFSWYARSISGFAFSKSAVVRSVSSRSPVPQWPILLTSRVKPASSATDAGSSLRFRNT